MTLPLPRIQRYLIHTVTILRGPTGTEGVGRDQWGEPLAAATPASLEVPARVEWETKRITDSSGQEVIATGLVFLAPSYVEGGTRVSLEIGPEDRLAFEGREYRLVTRERHEGWGWLTDARAHWELWIV